jgi:hypothetical protein
VSSEFNIAVIPLSNSGKVYRPQPTQPAGQKRQDIAVRSQFSGSFGMSTYIRSYGDAGFDVMICQRSQQISPSQAEAGMLAQYNPYALSSLSGHIANPDPIPIAGTPEFGKPVLLQRIEDWTQQDDERFDILVEKEALGKLDDKEAEELDQLLKKRDRTVVRVPEEDLRKEWIRSHALAELQGLLQKYAPLFSIKR